MTWPVIVLVVFLVAGNVVFWLWLLIGFWAMIFDPQLYYWMSTSKKERALNEEHNRKALDKLSAKIRDSIFDPETFQMLDKHNKWSD